VLTNLGANALRYTPPGKAVHVCYWQVEKQAQFEVPDSSPNIPVDELPHVFDRYYMSADLGGMRLGLVIAKQLVEVYVGIISAESALGPDNVTDLLADERVKKIRDQFRKILF
jgi:signal transduction histidine kinase